MVKKFRRYLYSFWRNSRTWRTDRQTDGHRVTAYTALMHMHRAVTKYECCIKVIVLILLQLFVIIIIQGTINAIFPLLQLLNWLTFPGLLISLKLGIPNRLPQGELGSYVAEQQPQITRTIFHTFNLWKSFVFGYFHSWCWCSVWMTTVLPSLFKKVNSISHTHTHAHILNCITALHPGTTEETLTQYTTFIVLRFLTMTLGWCLKCHVCMKFGSNVCYNTSNRSIFVPSVRLMTSRKINFRFRCLVM